MINWTALWHTRPPNFTDEPRDVIWQILGRKTQPMSDGQSLGGRLQHHQPRPYVERVHREGSEQLKGEGGELRTFRLSWLHFHD